jgi:hypothetical protein
MHDYIKFNFMKICTQVLAHVSYIMETINLTHLPKWNIQYHSLNTYDVLGNCFTLSVLNILFLFKFERTETSYDYEHKGPQERTKTDSLSL